jgi:hypothetical protein
MARSDLYRTRLKELDDWEPFLLRESRLPGPRANLELVQAAADEGDEARFLRLLRHDPDEAPTDSPLVFPVVCGVVGLGRLVAEGRTEHLDTLRRYASDPRWRVREAVAMALQRFGDRDMAALLGVMRSWSEGTPLEQRAAAAGLCEPRLLRHPDHARAVIQILDAITSSIPSRPERRSDDLRTLRQALGYCWSVAVCALPEEGKPAMERWFGVDDPDVRWIMRENLSKSRLRRLDAVWTDRWRADLTS